LDPLEVDAIWLVVFKELAEVDLAVSGVKVWETLDDGLALVDVEERALDGTCADDNIEELLRTPDVTVLF